MEDADKGILRSVTQADEYIDDSANAPPYQGTQQQPSVGVHDTVTTDRAFVTRERLPSRPPRRSSLESLRELIEPNNEDIRLYRAESQASAKLSEKPSSESDQSSVIAPTKAETVHSLHAHPTHVERWHSQVMQHVHTVGQHPDSKSAKSQELEPLPDFGAGKPYPPDIPAERAAYVVDFNGPNDILHPMNWPFKRKMYISAIGAFACFCSSFASSVLGAATASISGHFHISLEVASLLSALYLVGYGVGPALWGPLSELYGRRLPLIAGNFGFSVFAIGVAVAKDVQTLMICRFFMGLFGSSPLVVVAALYSDIWKAEQRGIALVVFAVSVFIGPMCGPFIGAFTVIKPYLGWRWDSYWSAIMGFTCFTLITLFLKETYPPAVLVSKAAYLRRRTKNWGIHAKQEEIEISLQEMLSKNVSRPIRMLFTEPILLLLGIYISFVYGLMYISLSAFPFVYAGVHHIKPGVSSLPFLGMAIGMIMAGVVSILCNPAWVKKYHAAGNRAEPEWRLPFAFVGAVVFVIGLFWFGWTGWYKSVHWIVPTIAAVFIGFGLLGIFMQLIMYIVDAYLMFAASALAGNTIMRSLFAAACPLFDRQMFSHMHVNWAMTLLGCLAAVMLPMPLLFMKYGPALRKKSKWVPQLPPPKVVVEAGNEGMDGMKAKGQGDGAALMSADEKERKAV